MYLKPPFETAGKKYPKKAPIAAAGVKVTELPATIDNPKGSKRPKTTPLEAAAPARPTIICPADANASSRKVKFSILFDILTISFKLITAVHNNYVSIIYGQALMILSIYGGKNYIILQNNGD